MKILIGYMFLGTLHVFLLQQLRTINYNFLVCIAATIYICLLSSFIWFHLDLDVCIAAAKNLSVMSNSIKMLTTCSFTGRRNKFYDLFLDF